MNNFEEKEKNYLILINSLIKQLNYSDLEYQFQAGMITSGEFTKKVKDNPGKYTINPSRKLSKEEFQTITKIIEKIERFDDLDFSGSGIFDYFSIAEVEGLNSEPILSEIRIRKQLKNWKPKDKYEVSNEIMNVIKDLM